ncbi:hypothetical protein KIW84_071805 [Lathyrus oleraceus]|uniref:Uncharacterized protein n=1 Tax=Pisum sativum TaxID=3888 RepID=A0A9D4ZTK8_PEA|nr:hypothetical protein KIW84_071805 [Pisum sativum]
MATNNTYDSILKFINSPSFSSRGSFPNGFLFGAGSSALQIEGAQHEGGRGLCIWDDIIEYKKGVYLDVDKFSKKIEHYKRYKEDVQLLKKLGVNSYRMSISWNRVMPNGTLEGGINQEGINFYNNLINELLKNGIEPFVTIMHFDYPLALQQKLGGFLNHSIVTHFKDFSELLFKTYGDRVKHWTTINEGEVTVVFQYMHNSDNMFVEACPTKAIDAGVNVRGYFAWAAFDTFEFQAGYSRNWGLYHVDFNDSLKRIPTEAANWYNKNLTDEFSNLN